MSLTHFHIYALEVLPFQIIRQTLTGFGESRAQFLSEGKVSLAIR